MSRRCVFFFLIQLLMDNAMAQIVETRKAVVGGTVILLCSTKPTAEIEDVFWRYEEEEVNRVVLNIIDGKENSQDQSQEYKGRVSAFSAEFAKGNFSIKLSDVKHSDAGTYTCDLSESKQNVQLSVEDLNSVEQVTGQDVFITQTTDPKTGDGTRRASSMFLLVCSFLYSLVF